MFTDYDFTTLLFILMRMFGCIFLNPVLGRNNLPAYYKAGFAVLLSLFTYGVLPAQTIEAPSLIVFGVLLVKELAVGFIIGFIVQIFMSVVVIGGEVMDMQIGISMSKIYDPGSRVSMALSASVLNVMFIFIFFLSNSHLTLIQIMVYSCEAVPLGGFAIPADLYQYLVGLLSSILIYALKMAMPVMMLEIIAEVGVGLLMKAVPQINVFVVNLQLKVFIGFLALYFLVPAYSSFIERLITLLFDSINTAVVALS